MNEAIAHQIGQNVLDMLAPEMSQELTDCIDIYEITVSSDHPAVCFYATSGAAAKKLSVFFTDSVSVPFGSKEYTVDFEVISPEGMH